MEGLISGNSGVGRGGGGGGPGMEKDYANEGEVELGLGLSLNSGKGSSGGGAWGGELYGRILTAKDFPNGFKSRINNIVGTKRAAAEVGSVSSNAVISQVVGWPPVGAHRMSSLVSQAKISNVDEGKRGGGNEKEESSKKKINHGNNDMDDATRETGYLGFVKVNVDGLTIGRKVDLNAHSCYESLAKTLEEMFFKSSTRVGESDSSKQASKLLDGSSEFELTYEDREGDWMLVGDVPWGMFLSTVKRLRIMKTSEANGLAQRFQETNDRRKGNGI